MTVYSEIEVLKRGRDFSRIIHSNAHCRMLNAKVCNMDFYDFLLGHKRAKKTCAGGTLYSETPYQAHKRIF